MTGGRPPLAQAATRITAWKMIMICLLALILAGAVGGCQNRPDLTPDLGPPGGQLPPPAIVSSADYVVRETITLVNDGPGQPTKHNLWVALIQDVSPYQSVKSMEISPSDYRPVTDEYGNRYAEFDLNDMPSGTTMEIDLDYRLTVHELAYDLGKCTGEVPGEFTQAELHVESKNPQIMQLAQALSKGQGTACEQVRAFYDYIGNHLVYSFNGADWGAQAALGEMGADCTEYSSLLIALSRAAGIPARYQEGLWARGGAGEGEARTEHAWLEVYLPGVGWTPMDPTLGRSSLSRETYFAHLPPDHVIVTVGRNPSTLRGASYWTHIYWPGKSTTIRVEGFEWQVEPVEK